jgi:hypothetical protein
MPVPQECDMRVGFGAARRHPRIAAVALVALTALLVGCAGAEPLAGRDSIAASVLPSPHVHAVAVNPGDGQVYLATHHGLFRYREGGTSERVGPIIDLMGFTVAGPNRFYASGHPGPGTDLPNPLGLLESQDGGKTWRTISRQGQSDFHSLTASATGILGFDGALLHSRDGVDWTQLPISAPPAALAGSRDGQTVLAATTAGVLRSVDAGRSWMSAGRSPALVVLGWAGGSAVGATAAGQVYFSADGGVSWEPRGVTDRPQAIGVAGTASHLRILVVSATAVLDSRDGGRTFTTLT